jgi:RNA polymerase sigma factor (sigma-70 family)
MSADESFAAWYGVEHPRVLAVLAVTSGDLDAAKEAAAEGFARAYERWDHVSKMSSPAGWTYRVSLNELRRTIRRARYERMLLRGQAPPPPIQATDSRAEVWDAVRQLPQRQRTAVALRYVADMTEQAIADVMDVRVGTVSATLHTARRRLAELLGDDALAEGGEATHG